MQFTVDIFTIIIVLGIAQGYFLALILFHNRNGNQKANQFLALLLCAFSTSISTIFLLKTGLYRSFPYTLKMTPVIILLFGPLFYFYVRCLIGREYRFQLKDTLHFLPAFIVFLHFSSFYFSDHGTKFAFVLYYNNKVTPEHYEYFTIIGLSQLQLWIYLFIIRRLLQHYQRKVKDDFSNTEKINLSWINFFMYNFAGVYIILIFLTLLIIKSNFILIYNILGVTVSLAIFALGYRGLKQAEIFSLMDPVKAAKSPSTLTAAKTAATYIDLLQNLMINDKLFTNPDLTLDDLAEKLSISRNALSQIINDGLGTNFYDYVNRFRVEEMKRLMLDPEKDHLTIVALAKDAGFNSKSTFNRVFKQHTRMTPSQYKQVNGRKPPV